jgi:hypothetical protein
MSRLRHAQHDTRVDDGFTRLTATTLMADSALRRLQRCWQCTVADSRFIAA